MTALQECRTCRFWLRSADSAEEKGWGNCLRYPPAVSNTPVVEKTEHWPLVRSSSWCGEYKPIVVEGAEG